MNQDTIVLSPGQAQVWVVPLDPHSDKVRRLESNLSADELARADRFITAELRNRFVLCRFALRQLLGRACALAASEIRFHYQQWGKPYLDRQHPVHFNVSHSGDWALIALASASLGSTGPSNTALGIDLEVLNRRINYRAIASQVLAPSEQTAWQVMPARDQPREIMRLWVCKEALLKAMGLGIAEGLQKVAFPFPIPETGAFAPLSIAGDMQLHLEEDASCSLNWWTDPSFWQLRMLEPLPDSFAAVATPRQVKHIQVHQFDFE